jgi:hypothetical protein
MNTEKALCRSPRGVSEEKTCEIALLEWPMISSVGDTKIHSSWYINSSFDRPSAFHWKEQRGNREGIAKRRRGGGG